jgi:RNA polymerase sigma-70 factor (ECF subfamily)
MDRAELAALYLTCGASVERRCRALLGHGEEAKDMTQEVFLRAVEKAQEFRGDAAPFTWLYRITTNLCLNRLRDRKQSLPIEVVEPVLRATGASPEHLLATKQSIHKLLSGLDARMQAMIVYHYLDGMSQEEIASVVGWSRRTLGKKLAAFEQRVHALMEKGT